MNAVIKSIHLDSPAARTILAVGDVLRRINGNTINDVLDYKFLSYDEDIIVECNTPEKKIKLVRIHKKEGDELGLEFEEYLMDNQRSCVNRCIFCFIDQLPSGMRETLYVKDDDVRLSFLQGNYVTLSNLSSNDIERIIKMRISPINVSVHTLDPKLRSYMLGTKKGADGISVLKQLVMAGISLNCQIVCCPGINDNEELSRTIEGLLNLGYSINSISVVPVGLTKHRRMLTKLSPFDENLANDTISLVDRYGDACIKQRGYRVVYCADELYITANIDLPQYEYYDDFPQLENGVGMMSLFINEFMDEMERYLRLKEYTTTAVPNNIDDSSIDIDANVDVIVDDHIDFSIATGVAASRYLTNLLNITAQKCGKIAGKVYAVSNTFFGDSVTVAGLLTAGDIVSQLKEQNLGTQLLIPRNMLRSGEDVFLDNFTVADVSKSLGVEVIVINTDGADLFRYISRRYFNEW